MAKDQGNLNALLLAHPKMKNRKKGRKQFERKSEKAEMNEKFKKRRKRMEHYAPDLTLSFGFCFYFPLWLFFTSVPAS